MTAARLRTAAAVMAAVLALGGYYAGRRSSVHTDSAAVAPAGPQTERKVLYWHDPMYPQQKFDKPGKSPFMNMQLVPVYADEQPGADSGVTVSSRAQQNLGVRTAVAEVAEFRQEFPAVGYVQADERRIVRAEVRSTGWVG